MPTDSDLLERARAGDASALDALLAQHQGQIYRFAMKLCRDPEDARDVLQETMLAMARGVHAFRGASSLSTWLYSVARSFCIKRRRRVQVTEGASSLDGVEGASAEQVAEPGASPDEALASREVERAVEGAITALDPMYREVLLLRDVEGLTAPEVASVLGITVQAVKSRLHRARLSVRAGVAPLLGVPLDGAQSEGTCPDVLTLFSQHLEDEISAEVCAQMEAHLSACARCRGACDSLRRTLAMCKTSAAKVEVPPEVQSAVRVAVRDFLGQR